MPIKRKAKAQAAPKTPAAPLEVFISEGQLENTIPDAYPSISRLNAGQTYARYQFVGLVKVTTSVEPV